MMQVCFKEGIKGITRPAMLKIVEGCNNDIRQVLHSLELIKASQLRGEMLETSKMYDNVKNLSEKVAKTSGLKNPFEDTRKIFSCSKQEYFKNHVGDIKEKKELFFNDYMMMPAWVFENYLSANPPSARNDYKNPFKNHARAIRSLSSQDVIGTKRMATQNWRLLTAESTNGVVIPGRVLCGGLSGGGWNGGLNFPGIWGKMSSMNKIQRLVGEVSCHTGKSMQCSSRSTFNMSYVSILNDQVTEKLKKQDIQGAVDLCLDYDMTKEDFDNMQEISVWEKKPSDFSKIESKVKSGFTRAFKKSMLSHQYPFAVEGAMMKKSKSKKDSVKIETVDSGQESEEEDDDNDDIDVALFAKKGKATKNSSKTAKSTKKTKKSSK